MTIDIDDDEILYIAQDNVVFRTLGSMYLSSPILNTIYKQIENNPNFVKFKEPFYDDTYISYINTKNIKNIEESGYQGISKITFVNDDVYSFGIAPEELMSFIKNHEFTIKIEDSL